MTLSVNGDAPEPPLLSGEPQWIEPTVEPTLGADPLGLQTITTDRLMPRVAPGVLAIADRARYFSYYSYLLKAAQRLKIADQESLSHFIKEREYELALAVMMCPRQCGSGPNGANAAGPRVRAGWTEFPRGESVESRLGGYGLYYRSPMRTMGLVATAGTPYKDTVLPVDVVFDDRAEAMAAEFSAAAGNTEYIRRYFGGTNPIPRDVLIEFAARACLCRLDEYMAERDAIRNALFGKGGIEPNADVDARQQAFALVIRFMGRGQMVDNDRALRRAVWNEFEAATPRGESPWAQVLGRWAALTGRDYTQEAIANLWVDGGKALQAQDAGWGLGRDGIEAGLRALFRGATLSVLGRPIEVDADLPTADFRGAVLDTTSSAPLPDLLAWAIEDGSALAGLAFLFALYARLPSGPELPGDWNHFAAISGDRQPGLLRLGFEIDEHLKHAPVLLDTLRWAIHQLVLLPHEWTANSKVPEFTYRFRWEGGRLVFFSFFDQPFGRFGLNDIHARSISRLSVDLGMLARTQSGYALTEDGKVFVDEIFAA